MWQLALAEPQRIGSPALGFGLALIIFLLSFALTYLLYKHFSK